MLRDMHYEGVYALARSAGMKPAVAGDDCDGFAICGRCV
jgi:hypothetical protein